MSRNPLKLAINAFAFIGVVVCASSLAQTISRGTTVQPVNQSAPVNGKYYALVIGINTYPAPLPSLKTAENDAKEVAAVLHDLYNFDSGSITTLLGQQATRSAILRALIAYRRSLQPEDSLLIYYAGHGYLDKDAAKAFWLPADADDALSPNTISADDITNQIRALPARHVLVISDSCYSGDLTRADDNIPITGGQPNLLNRMLGLRSRTMMSSGGDEPVSDNGKNNHSIFANALLSALKENNAPLATASDLFYGAGGVRHGVTHNAVQVPYYKPIPNSTDADGDFVLARTGLAIPDRAIVAENTVRIPVSPPDLSHAVALYEANKYSEAFPLFAAACQAQAYRACSYLGIMFEEGKGTDKDIDQAVTLYRSACSNGDGKGCTDLGLLYRSGVGVTRDDAKAASLHLKGCNGNYTPACSNLAGMYENGLGVIKDINQAVTLFKKACDDNLLNACDELGDLYQGKSGVTQDYTQAMTLYRKTCDAADLNGCAQMGVMYYLGYGVPQDYAETIAIYSKACDSGGGLACARLGDIYNSGKGAAQDYAQALTMYIKACDAGSGFGCGAAASMLYNGTGMVKDTVRATDFFRKSCDKNYAAGCAVLGELYFNGEGVEKNYAQSATYYGKACNGGNRSGCFEMGLLYANGQGVTPDSGKAFALYKMACDAKLPEACGNLGVLYETGNGIAQDSSQAAALYQQSCDSSNYLSCSNLGSLYANGKGVTVDAAKAISLYTKACDNKAFVGCLRLGDLYASKDTPANQRLAVSFYRKACDGDDAVACSDLAIDYEFGTGVTEDHKQSAIYYKKSCGLGHEYSCTQLKELQKH